MSCGCIHARRARDAQRRRRDAPDLAPPSSRRFPQAPASYAFAVKSALVRNHGAPTYAAERLLERWERLVEVRRREGRSAVSTAEHLARFESQHIVSPYGKRDRQKPRRRRARKAARRRR